MSTVQRRTLNYSFANGTSDREACSKRWLAILVRMNTERSCASLLSKVQIENYVPVQVEYHQWSDRRKKVERVVIPMVIFVYVNAEQEKSLYTYSFVHKILSYPGQKSPAVIPDEQITRLRFMLRYADSTGSVNDFLPTVGEEVEIVRGPLRGLRGELCMVQENRPMVVVRIDALGFACVNVAKEDIAGACR